MDLKLGLAVPCPHKSRRLAEAGDRVSIFMDQCARMGERYQCRTDFDGNEEVYHAAVRCHRYIVGYAKLKFAWLQRVPYLLVNCHIPEVARECLRQYSSTVPDKHHRVTREFCGEHGVLRRGLELVANGAPISEKLEAERHSLMMIPLTEEHVEGVHRNVTREHQRASLATVAWHSATFRLEQNLTEQESVWDTAAGLQLFLR